REARLARARRSGSDAAKTSSRPHSPRVRRPKEPRDPAGRWRSRRSTDWDRSNLMDATAGSLAPLATESQLRIQVDWPFLRPGRAGTRHVGFTAMDLEQLPPQIRALLRALDHAVKGREPAIRGRVENLRAAHPSYTNHQLA